MITAKVRGPLYFITYTGSSVVKLLGAGTFQTGTCAYVEEKVADFARAHGEFRVRGPIGQVGADFAAAATAAVAGSDEPTTDEQAVMPAAPAVALKKAVAAAKKRGKGSATGIAKNAAGVPDGK
jgi:hypothetical protein